MKRKITLFFLGLMLFSLLAACSAGMADEEPPAEAAPETSPTQGLPIAPEATVAPPRIPERRRLTLEFPPIIRAGDADTVRLTLEVDELGNITPTAEIDGNEISGEVVEIPDLYETHNIIAEAKMDMAGVEIVPAERVSEPLLRGESVTFYWSVRPEEEGTYAGRVWLYLRFVPKEGGEERTKTISSQPIEIDSRTFLGFKATTARRVGTIGSFLGAIFGFPFVDDVIKFLWKRFKKAPKS